MPSSRGSSWLRDRTWVSCLLHWQARCLPLAPPGKQVLQRGRSFLSQNFTWGGLGSPNTLSDTPYPFQKTPWVCISICMPEWPHEGIGKIRSLGSDGYLWILRSSDRDAVGPARKHRIYMAACSVRKGASKLTSKLYSQVTERWVFYIHPSYQPKWPTRFQTSLVFNYTIPPRGKASNFQASLIQFSSFAQ